VRIQGEEIQVRARVRMLDVYSGHADAKGLVTWAEARKPIAGNLLLTHGEPDALAALNTRLTAAGIAADRIAVPVLDQSFVLTKTSAEPVKPGARRLPPGAATSLDWHNARAEFLGRLQQRLESAPDDDARLGLIRSLSGNL
jgi:metallo-beta-lactamase family protein